MDSILLGALLGLASVTISLPLNLLRIYCKDSKDKNTNATTRVLLSPGTVAAALRQVVLEEHSIALEAAIMRKVAVAPQLLTIQMLPV